MSKIPVPEKLNANNPNKRIAWERFLQAWQNYEIAADISEMPDNKRLATFLTIIGYEAVEIYNTFKWSNSENRTLEATINKFKEFYEPKINLTYERFKFLTRKQASNETISEFVVALKTLAGNCSYGNLKDTFVCDALIIGIKDNTLRESLLRDNSLTLEKAMDTALAFENAKKQIGELENNEELNKITRTRTNEKIKCKFCDLEHEKNRMKCPANGKECFKCGRKNHFSSACKSKNDEKNIKMCYDENEDDDGDSSMYFIN